MKKIIITTSAFSTLFLLMAANAVTLPLVFTSQPSFPKSVSNSGTYVLNYTIHNNTPVTLPLSITTTVSAGTMGPNTGGCGSSLSGNNSCTLKFLYTEADSTNNVTGSVSINYNGRYPLTDNSVQFTARSGLALVTPSLMFVNRNWGNSASYIGKLLVINTSSTTAITGLTATITNNKGNTITLYAPSTTCTSTLAASGTCVFAYTSAVPVDTGASIVLTSTNSNTVTAPVAAISVASMAAPLSDTFYQLYLVPSCTTAAIIQVTNNSSGTVSDVGATASNTLSAATITNNASSTSNNYCNGASLAQNQSCEITITTNSIAANTTGTFTFNGSGTENVVIPTKVVAAAAPFPYATGADGLGNTIFVANNACNLVKVVSGTSDTVTNDTWSQAVTYCSGTINTKSDWRMPDVGPTPGLPDNAVSLTGEFSTLYNGGAPYGGMITTVNGVYWGAPAFTSVNSGYSWAASFFSATQQAVNPTTNTLTVRCVRAFTTNASGT